MNQANYLFLYLKTGGGHLAPARSVSKYLSENENVTINLVDGFEQAPKFVKNLIEDGYRKSQNHAIWAFEFLYAFNKIGMVAKSSANFVSRHVKAYLKQVILREQPAKIVIFHFFLIQPIYELVKELELTIPILTVVTDPYTAHPIWILNKKQNFIVFSEEVKNYFVSKKVEAEKIHVFPFVIDEKFSSPMNDTQIQATKLKLGLSPEKKLILILGGADGIPRGKKIVKQLVKSHLNAQIVMVCGKNKKLYQYACKLKEKTQTTDLVVFGYIDFVYELLNASDIVISKCGASTFMEILMTKKISIISDYIWEQEKGNVDFIRKNDLGVYENNIDKMVEKLSELVENPKWFRYFKFNLERANLKNGTSEVAQFISNF